MWSKVFSLGGTTTESPPTPVFSCHFLSPLQEICPLNMYPSSHPLITHPVAGSLSQPVRGNRFCSEIQESFPISHLVSCAPFKFHLDSFLLHYIFLIVFLGYNSLVVLSLLSSLALVSSPAGQRPQGFTLCRVSTLSPHASLEFPFLQLHFSAFPDSAFSIFHVNSRVPAIPLLEHPTILHECLPLPRLSLLFGWPFSSSVSWYFGLKNHPN